MRKILILAVFSLVAGALPVVPAAAQNRTPPSHMALEETAGELRPGQFVWRDTGLASLPVSVIISLPQQTAFVFRGDAMIGAAAISSGKSGKRTPAGDFPILQKKVFHRSNLYSNAPMPFMQRLTWDGIALHAGHNPGYPASHGCIRLPHGFAVLLYGVTSLGTQVGVLGEDSVAPRPAPVILVAQIDSFADLHFATVTWGGGPWGAASGGDRSGYQVNALIVRDDEFLVPDIDVNRPY